MAIAINFDTLEIAKELEKVGFSQQQAETITKIQKRIITENLENTIASKADIVNLENTLREDILRLENKIDLNTANIRSEMLMLKYMLGIIIALLTALTLKFMFA